MKEPSEVMFFNGELTGVTATDPLDYRRRYLQQDADKPGRPGGSVGLYEKKQWNITKFLEYVEELTVDQNHDNKPEVFGVSQAPEALFQMAVSSGEDLVKFNADGTVSNNIRSATFTRWAGYARQIEQMGSYDTESWTAEQRFVQGKIAMMAGKNIWNMFASNDLIQMKKQDRIGWVPHPMDVNAKTYYQQRGADHLVHAQKFEKSAGRRRVHLHAAVWCAQPERGHLKRRKTSTGQRVRHDG